MPFVEVVQGYEICNFPIIHLVHFRWKNWRKTRSKGASLNVCWPLASRAHRRAAAPLGPHAEAGFGSLVHVPWAALAEPPSRSYPLTPRASSARLGCVDRAARPMALPPYRGHATAHATTLLPWRARRLPTALCSALKPFRRPSRACV
jgi:hypothetical protein